MVMSKRAATELPTWPNRIGNRPAGRFTVACKPQRAPPPIKFKPVRRPDQRSAVSIAGSCATLRSGAGSSSRWTPAGGCRTSVSACSGDIYGGAGCDRIRAQAAAQRPSRPPPRSSGYSVCGGDVGVGGLRYLRKNSLASNSAGANAQLPLQEPQDLASGLGNDLLANAVDADIDPDAGLPSGWRHQRSGRRSFGTGKTVGLGMGKTVSITASQEARTHSDIDRTASSRLCTRSQSEVATKSIIKLRPLPPNDRIISTHNEDGTMGEPRAEPGITPHQIREQKIFGECRFIPSDTFYKKALVAPNQERHFFAAPRCSRVPGSGMLYDIANQNSRHHQDCNFDSTRDMLKRTCPNFLRTTQFRHIY